MSFKPTAEQENVVAKAEVNSLLKVEAVSGSGKTSSLALVTQAIRKPTLYMAFNKTMATEASMKFGSHVTCKSCHSVAFGYVGKNYVNRLNRPKGKYKNVAGTPSEIAKYYNLKGKENAYMETRLAAWVKETVTKFEQSADGEITLSNVPTYAIKKHLENAESKAKENELKWDNSISPRSVALEVLSHAKKLWEDRIDRNGEILITHDTYLKLFQLSKPQLPFEVVLLDEAQDANPVIIDLVMQQAKHAKVILVGDTYQQIYQWRGAENALELVTAQSATLTKSFRFGSVVAEVANAILDKQGFVKGNESLDTVLDDVDTDQPYTKIYRTNSQLLSEAVGYINSGEEVRLEVDLGGFTKKLQAIQDLYSGKETKHPDIIGYTDFNDLKDNSEDDPEVSRMIKMVEQGNAINMLITLNTYRNPSKAHITLTTAHKSKGLEWDQVVLADDFQAGVGKRPLTAPERNLLYVAATRAQKVLQPNIVTLLCLEGKVLRG